jgi:hypothetical protein
MYYYNINGKLQTSFSPIKGKTPVSLTKEQAEICSGFDNAGNPVLDNSKLVLSNIRLKLAECETEYNRRLNAGIEYNSKIYDSDDKAQKFITSLVTALTAGIITKFDGFTLKDNSTVNLTGNQIKELGGVLLSHVDTCHKWKKAKQAEINSCTSADQVRAVTF